MLSIFAFRVATLLLHVPVQLLATRRAGDPASPLLKPVVEWLKRDPERQGAVIAGMRGMCARFEVEPIVEQWAVLNAGLGLQRGLAALCACAACCANSDALFLFALSFELGKDLLQSWCLFRAFRFKVRGKLLLEALPVPTAACLGLRHLLGTLVVAFAYLYLPHRPEAKRLAALLSATALPPFLGAWLRLAAGRPGAETPASRARAAAAAAAPAACGLGALLAVYIRFCACVPLVYALEKYVLHHISFGAACAFGMILFSLAALNLASLGTALPAVAAACRAETPEKQIEAASAVDLALNLHFPLGYLVAGEAALRSKAHSE